MTDPSDRELAVFSEARRLPVAERAKFLDRACAGDPTLRKGVEELLQSGEEAGEFLETPAAEPLKPGGTMRIRPSPDHKPGERIGRYKLLQQIGEGGCGVVYMAEQEEPVRRRVALKVLKPGMDTKQVIARFEAERQALALMDHPNIAKVLDAGATEPGRPYFVMELVRGIKITEYCDANNLSIRERLQLFVEVCRAIQHAHQKGIIHRDIKPSNILVTINDGVPVPKVIDFGIAKATQGRLTDQTLFTAFEQFIGTPAYMSPEQAAMTSLDVDTRSDIYSLGVLLYELLTGQTPFDQQELLKIGFDEMRRTIREREPQRPSTRLSTMAAETLTPRAKQRHTEAPKLIHIVRGDLDWIVMKALEKDRNRRYETATGFARDIERYLADEPVTARPPSRLYEFQKTVRRHKFGFGAAAMLILVLMLGVIASTLEAIRARRAEQEQIRLRQEAEANEGFAAAEVLYLGGDYQRAEVKYATLPAAVVKRNPQRATRILTGIGEYYVRRGLWNPALSNFTLALKVDPADYSIYYRLAPLLVQTKQVQEYRRTCQLAVTQFKGTTDALTADRMAKTALMLPDSRADIAIVSDWINTAVEAGTTKTEFKKFLPAIQNTKAFMEYRLGHYQSALEWEQKSVSGSKLRDWVFVQSHLVSAMALFQLNRADEAREQLGMANSISDKEDYSLARLGDNAWIDGILTHHLRAEAEALIKGQTNAPAVDAKAKTN